MKRSEREREETEHAEPGFTSSARVIGQAHTLSIHDININREF